MADSINTTNIETIIQLRHDTQEKWNSTNGKDTHLEPGEAAVEIIGNKVKVKIGTEECDTFETAPYIGGEDAQTFQMTTPANYNAIDGDVIAARLVELGNPEVHDGDIFIVKKYISSENTGKFSYTSYVYDSSIDVKWVAMDGNYSANNIVFANDIILAGSYTAVGNVTKSSTTATGSLTAKGKTLAEVMQSIFTKEDYENGKVKDDPIVEFTATGAVTGEVGTSFSRPTGTLKVKSIGAYYYKCGDANGNTYNGSETGVTFNNLKVAGSSTKTNIDTRAEVLAATTSCNATTSSGLVKDASISYTASATEIPSTTFTETKISYYFGGAADSASSPRKALTNLGNFAVSNSESSSDYADGTRFIPARVYGAGESGNRNIDVKTWSAQGWRGWFQGYKAAGSELNVNALTSANIRGLMTTPINGSFNKSITGVPAKTNQLIFACPKGKISYTLKSDGVTVNTGFTAAQSTPATPLTVKHTTASVEGANGFAATEYDVFYCNDVGFIETQTVTITY